ncbi:MAG TPA: hypothetical protein VNV66_15670 [Pilimelia sp.]|nr:hypothetical protein [Pilimelia sp.]
MDVVDAAGDRVGVVSAVQPPGTDVRPDLPAGVGEPFMATGYLRIDGTGELATDTYVGGEQVASVSEADGVVTLAVPWAELTRAA